MTVHLIRNVYYLKKGTLADALMPGDDAEWTWLSFTAWLHFPPVDHVSDCTYVVTHMHV